jgi:hypothetical protein
MEPDRQRGDPPQHLPATEFLRIPPDRVIEIAGQVEI